MTDLNPTSATADLPLSGARFDEASQDYFGLSADAVVKILILAPLFIAVYWLVLRWLWDKTNPFTGEANWGHAICIPFVGIYYLFINREDLLKQPVEPVLLGSFTDRKRLIPGGAIFLAGALIWGLLAVSPSLDSSGYISVTARGVALFGFLILALDWGIGSLLFGLITFAYGIWPGQNQFLQGCAMIVTLFAVVLILCGWRVMRYAWFPIVYLICGIPWPQLVYSYVASPLQTFAARVAVVSLRFTGVTAFRTGTKINIGGIADKVRTLNVAEACAGLRSLMTFITVGMAVAFLSARPLWQKIVITLSAIPIAIFCNVMRVAGQGLLYHYAPEPYNDQLANGFAHQFVGLVMLVPAFFLILLVGWVLDHLFVEEIDDPRERAARAAAVAAAAGGTGLVVEIPRKLRVQPVVTRKPPKPLADPAASPSTKTSAKTQTTPPVAPAKPQSPQPQNEAIPPAAPKAPAQPPAAPRTPVAPPAPAAPVTPPRPGIVPPRPGVIPPRPGIVAPRPGVIPPKPGATKPPQNKPPTPPQTPPQEGQQ